MSGTFTKAMARNIFYGGAVFFFLLLVALTFDTMKELPKSDNRENLTESVLRGKHVWETRNCIGCHTLLGEGAYFAPELGNVWTRMGGDDDVEATRETFKAWMASQPTGIEGRRQMPQFHLSDRELNDLSEFLRWTSTIKTQNWPPNEAG